MKGDLGAPISLCQTTFVSGRHLLDGILVANEVLDLVTRTKKSWMLFNIDFEKVYDKRFTERGPLYPFLFVLATEGLAGLIRKVVVQSDFSVFQVSERYLIEVLQLQISLFFWPKANGRKFRALKRF
ncbi:hypothetical protein KIW84_034403 [Lathyrus oleraceus]|uniref:Uncharacterized protein n=1 Tax=Pisum sativum TaxID=3888 RepID=A0A9D5AZC1_PEA|nr:hypothetical protein KIW84_034403 [Pisum sativum]